MGSARRQPAGTSSSAVPLGDAGGAERPGRAGPGLENSKTSARGRGPMSGALVARPPGAAGGRRRAESSGSAAISAPPFPGPTTKASISSRVRRSVTATSRPVAAVDAPPRRRRRPARRPGSPPRPCGSTTVSAGTGSRRANSRRIGAGASRDTPGMASSRLPGVAGPPGAAQRQLAQPRGAEPRQLDHGAPRR